MINLRRPVGLEQGFERPTVFGAARAGGPAPAAAFLARGGRGGARGRRVAADQRPPSAASKRVRARAAWRTWRAADSPDRACCRPKRRWWLYGANEMLAFDPSRSYSYRGAGRHGEIALAHRARLRGTKKRTRPCPFRRAGVARFSSSRNALHCCLWLPDPRTSGDSPPPPQPQESPNGSVTPSSETPKAPPIRPERHVENSIATIRRKLTVALAKSLMRCPCRHARHLKTASRGSS